jgi:glycosyltransferase involved in cell wall biosynthesis
VWLPRRLKACLRKASPIGNVVDDGSSDDTEDVVARFADPRIRYYKKDHAGHCAARNHALRLAKGALIAYLDSDDIWYPDFLASAAAAFAADPSIESAYGALVSEVHLPGGQRLSFAPFDREVLLNGNFIGMDSFIHRRELYERFGGFDESLRRLVDWDLILRYTQKTPARRLPVIAVRVRRMDAHKNRRQMASFIGTQRCKVWSARLAVAPWRMRACES